MGIDDFKRSYPLCTVCEVTRQLADIIIDLRARGAFSDSDYDNMWNLLKTQMRMQKKMDAKLRQYKADYEQQMFDDNPEFKQLDNKRKSYETL